VNVGEAVAVAVEGRAERVGVAAEGRVGAAGWVVVVVLELWERRCPICSGAVASSLVRLTAGDHPEAIHDEA
jgi:hypothetical protein